jgi:predicted house-cleaning NTP pyrophosphatase (Maf/HAM1 superfamily)
MTIDAQHPRVHLASRSPRRRELLAQIGVGFDTIVLSQFTARRPRARRNAAAWRGSDELRRAHRAQQGGTRL